MVMIVMMMTVVVVMIMSIALLYVCDDLLYQGTGNRHIIVAGSRTSRWPILTLSESQHQKLCQYLHQPESINQVLATSGSELVIGLIGYKSEESGHHCHNHCPGHSGGT